MIVVSGSVAVDLVANVPCLPRPVVHVATCGNDAFASAATGILRSRRVDLTHRRTIDGPTGVCLVAADPGAETTVRRISHDHGYATVVTRGADGTRSPGATASVRRRPRRRSFRSIPPAGDVFVGAFAAALDHAMDSQIAVRRGVVAGSLSCMWPDAQAAIPMRCEIDELVGKMDRLR